MGAAERGSPRYCPAGRRSGCEGLPGGARAGARTRLEVEENFDDVGDELGGEPTTS